VAGVNGLVLLPAGRAADRIGRRPILVAGCALSGFAFLLLALWSTLPGFLVSMAILGLGSGLLDVAPAAIVGDVVEGRGGPVFAAYTMSSDVANVIGPVLAGAIAESSYSDAFGLTAAILGVAVVAGLLAPETRDLAQRRAEVGDQVVDVLDADREPDEVARKQMSRYGGMIAFRVRGGEAQAVDICGRTTLFTLAESLGGVESLIEHPGRMTHASAAGSPLEVPGDLVRLSVGIENADDLLADLRAALA
jgi:MFS family permease